MPTPDETALERAKKALDDGDIFEAMKLSRGLLDSKEAFVRSSLVDIFRWVGKRALPELSELVRDGDPGVAHEALVAWEFVLQEVHHDFAKVTAITNLASSIDNPAVIDAVFMHIINVESRYSLPALEGLVMEYKGKTCCQCAKRMFEHIAGEPWSSPERTLAILKKEGEVK